MDVPPCPIGIDAPGCYNKILYVIMMPHVYASLCKFFVRKFRKHFYFVLLQHLFRFILHVRTVLSAKVLFGECDGTGTI